MRSQNAHALRNAANDFVCPQCHAAPGTDCFRKNAAGERVTLEGPPAHWGRMDLARKRSELPFDEAGQ